MNDCDDEEGEEEENVGASSHTCAASMFAIVK